MDVVRFFDAGTESDAPWNKFILEKVTILILKF